MTRRNPKADDPNRAPYVTIFVRGDDYDRAIAAITSLECGLTADLAAIRRVLVPPPLVDEYGYQPNVQRSYPLIRR